MNEEQQPKKRRLSVKAWIIIAVAAAFAVGMIVEIWKHSDSRIKSLLEENRSSFEACAQYFDGLTESEMISMGLLPKTSDSKSTEEKKKSGYTSIKSLAGLLSGEKVCKDILKLGDIGIQKIVREGAEIRFYTDLNSGICYISPASAEASYYPEGYLDETRIDGDFYRFGTDVKKKK